MPSEKCSPKYTHMEEEEGGGVYPAVGQGGIIIIAYLAGDRLIKSNLCNRSTSCEDRILARDE